MDLLLWRHAEAEEGLPDLQRKLTGRGERQARQMADWLKAHAPKQMHVIASPALRTQQTARAFQQHFSTDKRLAPDAGVSDLLSAIHWPDGMQEKNKDAGKDGSKDGGRCRAVLVVGHQPVIGRTAALLLAGEEADWSIKKGAIWWFSNRVRAGETQTVLRAMIAPEFC